ncbi:MAG TPA: carbohydrate kinase family protein [Rubrivivax sp.]|nr:carbohydrate kinase family protein [Rubrivivax sp.]HRZ60754.1 carbohydrate kinase family protein [Rubrivivax sp.]
MTLRAAIAASMAYDTIMVFEGQFTDHILPDQIHKINLSFLSPRMRREYGGCAGNIAYNYKLVGGEPVPIGMVGDDFGPYLEHCRRWGIDASCLVAAADSYTAQCFIVTDLHNNQLAGFHPGAMSLSARIPVAQAGAVACGLVGPDAKDAMQLHARQMADAKIPFVLDPGQNIVLFSGPELLELIELAPVLVCNDYEAELVADKTGRTLAQLARRVDTLIVTRGGEGSVIHHGGEQQAVPVVPAAEVRDPTGCGDAYRAGLLLALAKGLPLLVGAQLGSVLGSIKIAVQGCQNHQPTLAQIRSAYESHYGAWPF